MSTNRNQIERRQAITAAQALLSTTNIEVIDSAAAPNVNKKRLTGSVLQSAILTLGPPTSYASDGAIALTSGQKLITKTSAAAMTLAAPTSAEAGMKIAIISTTAYAHVITATGAIEDGRTGGTKDTITLPAYVGAGVLLEAVGVKWVVIATNADAQDAGQTTISGDGAITIAPGTVILSKGSAAAITLAAPTAAQNGTRITVISTSAYAHVITATSLLEDGVTGGTKSTITLPAFVGAAVQLEAVGLTWTVVGKNSHPQVAVQTTISGDAAITISPGTVLLTKGSAAALTLAAPTAAQAGTRIVVTSNSAYAHVITATSLLEDGVTGGTKSTFTFPAFIGATVVLEANNLKWTVISSNSHPQVAVQTTSTADGAIAVVPGTHVIARAGAPGLMTLAAPTAAQAGTRIRITAGTAQAHVVTATGLIEDGITGGAKNTATFGAFVGSSIDLEAVNLKWHVIGKNVVTVA